MRVLAFNVAHDSSVCSYVDGQIEFYCKEERLTRAKRDDCPFKTLDLYHQQNFGPIDHILYHCPSSKPPESILDDGFKVIEKYIYKKFDKKLNKFDDMRHHQCHASSAFYNSGFSTALVFVIDRNGSMFYDGDQYSKKHQELRMIMKLLLKIIIKENVVFIMSELLKFLLVMNLVSLGYMRLQLR